MNIELFIYYNKMTIWFLFIIQSINLPFSAATLCSLQPSIQYTHYSSHYIFSAHTLQQPLHLQCTLQPCTAMYSYLQPIFSAHCSHVQPCTAICSQSSVYPAANCSHLQPPTLQLYHSVHIAATLSDANTIQCI